MCGIAGFLAADARAPARLDLVRTFAAAMMHRGPDGGGIYGNGPVAFAHRRLSIIDLSPAGFQPMTNEDGSVAILVNGEIYNHRGLRAELEAKGHRFRSHSDSEVIAHLFEEVGADFPRHLRGMFAAAVYEALTRRLFLARDRFGEKPLYYLRRGDGFAFASELAALLADPGTEATLSPTALDLYLALQYVPAPRTIFQQIHKLPAGHLLTVACGEAPALSRYHTLSRRPLDEPIDETELVARTRALVEESVRLRMMSDVPLGAFLSGGLDSSIVVACMAKASSQPVRTFSVGFEGTELDELPFARAVARRFGTEHQELTVRPRPSELTQLLPRIVRHHGEPFGDSSTLPTQYLCEMTRRQVTVALSGDASDEAFGGYRRYARARAASLAMALPFPLPALVATVLRGLPGARAAPVRAFGRRLGAGVAARYLALVGHFSWGQRRELYTPGMRERLEAEGAPGTAPGDRALALLEGILRASRGGDEVNRLSELDTETYLPDDIFAKVDTASMMHGLEARAPFADHLLMELAARIPGRLKLRRGRGKLILRRAFAGDLPPEILTRPKKGFASPTRGWFAGPLRGFARELLLSAETRARGVLAPEAIERLLAQHAAGVDHGERIWDLVVLEIWHRELVDGRARFGAEVADRARTAPLRMMSPEA